MTREITATLSGYDNPSHRMNWVLEIAYDTNPLRIWNGNGAITITGLDGEFLPSHGIGEMPEAQFGFEANEIALGLHLAIADPDIIEIIRNGGHGRVAVRVWVLYSDGDENYYSAPHDDNSPAARVFQGALDFVSFQFDAESTPKTLRIAVPVQHRFYSDNGVRHRGAQFTQYTQARIDENDTSWRFLPFLQRTTVLGRWGPAPVVPRVKGGFSFGSIIQIGLVVGITLISGGTAAAAAFTGFTAFVQQRLALSAARKAAREYGRIDQRIEIVSNDPIPVRRFVFGHALVGGDQLFIGVEDDVYLQQVVMIADHSIESIQSFWVGIGAYSIDDNFALTAEDENFPESETDYGDLIKVSARIDGVSALEIPILTYTTETRTRAVIHRTGRNENITIVEEPYEVRVPSVGNFAPSEWNPTADTATGTTIVFIEMEYDTEMSTGTQRRVPWQNIRFLVRGYNKVYDPRDKSFGYSDNAALVAGAFMNLIGGFPYIWANGTVETAALNDAESAAQTGGISAEDLIIAADICDANGWTVAGGIDFDDDFAQSKTALETAMMGSIFFDGWNYIIRAAHASEIKGTIDDETPLANISGTFHRRLEDLYNSVTGKIRNDPTNARYEETNYPVYEDKEALEIDQTPRLMNLDLPFTNSTLAALQLSSIALSQNRAGRELDINWPGRGSLQYRPGDRVVVNLTMPIVVENTIFIITEVNRDYQRNTHRLTLMEDPDSVYEYNEQEIEGLMALVADPVPPNTGFESTALPQPTGVRLYTSYEPSGYIAPDGSASFEVLLEVDNIAPDYIIEVQKLSLDYWISVGVGYSEITNLGIGTISLGPLMSDTEIIFRVRYRHELGLVSEWVRPPPYTVIRDNGVPPSPEILDIIGDTAEGVVMIIRGVPIPDFSNFEVRFTRAELYSAPEAITTEDQWRTAELLTISSAPPLPSDIYWKGTFSLRENGSYRIYARAIDRSGNYSSLEDAPWDTVNFTLDRPIRRLATHGNFYSWFSGDTILSPDSFVNGINSILYPRSNISGAQLDNDRDAVAKWNNEQGWFISPLTASAKNIIFPEVYLGSHYDGVYSSDIQVYYPPDITVDVEASISRSLRVYNQGQWSDYETVDRRTVISGSRVQLMVTFEEVSNTPLAASFGIKSVKQSLSTYTVSTPPVELSAVTTALLDYADFGFVAVPEIIVSIISIEDNIPSRGAILGLEGANTENVLILIQDLDKRDLVNGVIKWSARGLV